MVSYIIPVLIFINCNLYDVTYCLEPLYSLSVQQSACKCLCNLTNCGGLNLLWAPPPKTSYRAHLHSIATLYGLVPHVGSSLLHDQRCHKLGCDPAQRTPCASVGGAGITTHPHLFSRFKLRRKINTYLEVYFSFGYSIKISS